MFGWLITHVLIMSGVVVCMGWTLFTLVDWAYFKWAPRFKTVTGTWTPPMKDTALQNSILKLESSVLSVDFYTWVDALTVVVDYLVGGDIPVFWPGISEYTDVPACDLVTKVIEFKKTTNHKLDHKLRWVGGYIPWNCTCGKRLGVTLAFPSERVPGFAEHLKEIKELQSW